MNERMLNKNTIPSVEEIMAYIGKDAEKYLHQLEAYLEHNYDLVKELKFPFGKDYGWGYKYSHKSKHLLYVFFEKNSITATLQIGDEGLVEKLKDSLSSNAQLLWENRYPCGKKNGGWIHYRIAECEQLNDIFAFVQLRCKNKKIKPI